MRKQASYGQLQAPTGLVLLGKADGTIIVSLRLAHIEPASSVNVHEEPRGRRLEGKTEEGKETRSCGVAAHA